MGYVTEKIQDRLDLDAKQKTELDQLGSELLVLGKGYHQERKANLQFLIQQIEKDQIAEQDIQGFVDNKINRLESSLPSVIQKLKSFHGSLNKDQKQQIAQVIRDRLDRIEE